VHRSLSKYLVLFALILLAANCKRKPLGAEGKIRFRITYEQSRVGGYSAAVLPKEMTMEFNNDRVRNTIEGGLGFFTRIPPGSSSSIRNTSTSGEEKSPPAASACSRGCN
jgi:hypothetical protein